MSDRGGVTFRWTFHPTPSRNSLCSCVPTLPPRQGKPALADGTAKIQGNADVLKQLASTMVEFDPRFEIMPGTKATGIVVAQEEPYEADVGRTIVE